MKIRFIVLTSLSLFVGACASTGSKSDFAGSTPRERDQRYIAAVETKADKAGVEVIWVNPPTRDPKSKQ